MSLPTPIKTIHTNVSEMLAEIHSKALVMLETTVFNKHAPQTPTDFQRAVKVFMNDQVVNPISLEIDKMRIYIETNSHFLSSTIIDEIEDLRFHLLEIMTDVTRNARVHLEAIVGSLCEIAEHHCCKEERYKSYLEWREV